MKIAKYVIVGVLALSMVAGMVACGTATQVDNATTEATTADDAAEATSNEAADETKDDSTEEDKAEEQSEETSEEKAEKDSTEPATKDFEETTTEQPDETVDPENIVEVGEWSVNDAKSGSAVGISKDIGTSFEKAVKDADSDYEPIAVIGIQETDEGTNYKVLCHIDAPDGSKFVYVMYNDNDGESTFIDKEILDLKEMSETVDSMGTPRNSKTGYSVYVDDSASDLGNLKDLFTEYTSASAATCSYTPKAVLGSKTLDDGTTDYAILCTRTLFNNKKGDKIDYGIAFLHVGESRADTFMRQVHLLNLSE